MLQRIIAKCDPIFLVKVLGHGSS